jgi:hypothetical protein
MHTIIIDPTVQPMFGSTPEQMKICDLNGRLLGYFLPTVEVSQYRGVESPNSAEELRRRDAAGGGRSLQEILADLESRQ